MLVANMTKRLSDHPAFEPGEVVRHAVYGLGKGALRLADQMSGVRAGLGYSDEHQAATGGLDVGGFGAMVQGSGVLALTNRRLVFFRKATVIGTPKTITAEIPIEQVVRARHEKPMLTVEFADGSTLGLHVPPNQRPEEIVDLI